MAEIIETSPCDGLGLPIASGACRLEEITTGPITSVTPLLGAQKAVDKCLRPMGLRFPAPGKVTHGKTGRLVWSARGQAFLIGTQAPAPLAACAALTDQSDGWAALLIAGDAAQEVLARLLPIDLRPASMPPGNCARSILNHMPVLVIRVAEDAFEVLVFRSMAQSAVHELAVAMAGLSARHR